MKSKLVRDHIPQLIKASGDQPHTHIADDVEYGAKLAAKLLEEALEYTESHEPAELIDIIEVIYALGKMHQLTPSELESLRKKKHQLRGGFSKRIILDNVTATSQKP